jgi:hypothetical protein
MKSNSEIDAAILSVCEPSWKKVAMIVCRTAIKLGDLPEGDEGYHLVAKRIKLLVRNGRLEAEGDLSKWRYSEVRLPN